jgi:hypothetical protein
VTKRAVEMVTQKPLFQALAVEDVQTPQLSDFLRAVDLLQADGTGCVLVIIRESKKAKDLPNKLAIHSLGKTHFVFRAGKPVFQPASGRNGIQITQALIRRFPRSQKSPAITPVDNDSETGDPCQ